MLSAAWSRMESTWSKVEDMVGVCVCVCCDSKLSSVLWFNDGVMFDIKGRQQTCRSNAAIYDCAKVVSYFWVATSGFRFIPFTDVSKT